ncbi:MAG: cyclase family protein [Spirochaetota bacterium]
MSSTRIIDLSYTTASDMLVYPQNQRPAFQWIGRVNSEGFNLTKVSMLVHTGTHVDAPKHFLDNVPCIDELPLDRFFGKAKLFRFKSPLKGQEITIEDVVNSGFKLEEGAIFVLETGIERYAETKKYNELYPVPSEKLVDWLVEKKIRAYMTDATAVDYVGSETSPVHHQILGAGIPIVENLKNLHLLPENRYFLISALPLKFKGREGAPCRAVAFPDIESI